MSAKKSAFIDSEAEESDVSILRFSPFVVAKMRDFLPKCAWFPQQDDELEPHERVRLKKLKAMSDSEEEDEEDGKIAFFSLDF